MASKTDVENALVAIVDTLIYPAGDTGASACGVPARIYRGAPSSVTLDADLAAGVAHVTVYEQAGFTRLNPNGYMEGDIPDPVACTLTATVSGAEITIGGTPAVGQLVGFMVGNAAYAYAVAAGDTLATIARQLAGMIGLLPITTQDGAAITDSGGHSLFSVSTGVAAGAVITITTTLPIVARAAMAGSSLTIARRQDQGFAVTVWAPSPSARDAVADYIDAQLAGVRFLTMPDTTGARLLWRGDVSNDMTGVDGLWKRSLSYTVTYLSTAATTAPPMLFGTLNETAANPSGATLATNNRVG